MGLSHLERGEDGRELAIELHVHDGADDLRDLATRKLLLGERRKGARAGRHRTGGVRGRAGGQGRRGCGRRRRSRAGQAAHGTRPAERHRACRGRLQRAAASSCEDEEAHAGHRSLNNFHP